MQRGNAMLIVRGRHYLTGEMYDFHLEDGVIQAIASPASGANVMGGADYWVAPGLIDIQVNGYQGHDFCSGNKNCRYWNRRRISWNSPCDFL